MGDLKYLTPEQLRDEMGICKNYIANLQSKAEGQKVRLEWIEKYLFEKTPQELSISEIERKLGHKVIIRGK